jgi:hypothetical protein
MVQTNARNFKIQLFVQEKTVDFYTRLVPRLMIAPWMHALKVPVYIELVLPALQSLLSGSSLLDRIGISIVSMVTNTKVASIDDVWNFEFSIC